MDNLPAELHLNILSFLKPVDLSAFGQCSRACYQLATPLLYKYLDWTLPTNSAIRTKVLILQSKEEYCRYLRHIVVSPLFGTPVTPIEIEWVGDLVSSILDKATHLQSFKWDLNYSAKVHSSCIVPSLRRIVLESPQDLNNVPNSDSLSSFNLKNIRDFRCRRIKLGADVCWVKQFSEQPQLRRLHLGMMQCQDIIRVRSLLSPDVPEQCLVYLSLERLSLLDWPHKRLRSLKTLILSRCSDVEVLIYNPPDDSLPRLRRLALHQQSSLNTAMLGSFVGQLSNLTDLALTLESCSERFPIRALSPILSLLTSISLMCRKSVDNVFSNLQYTPVELCELLRWGRKLNFLSLAVNLRMVQQWFRVSAPTLIKTR